MKKLALSLLILLVSFTQASADSQREELIRARLEKVELVIKGGDANTAMGMLENLSLSYPETTVFHERAMDLALKEGAIAMANKVAKECLKRDYSNKKARAVMAQVYEKVIKNSHHVKDLQSFDDIAMLIETNRRCRKLTRALFRASRKGMKVGKLTKDSWSQKVAKLHQMGLLLHAIPCPLPAGWYESQEDGTVVCPAAKKLTLGLPQQKPVIERTVLIGALTSPSIVSRAHARVLLLKSEDAKDILEAIDNQCTPLEPYDQRELLDSLILALRQCGEKGGSEAIATYCNQLLKSPARDLRQLAAYLRFLALDRVNELQFADYTKLLERDSRLAAARDISYLSELVQTNREFAQLMFKALRSGKHRLAPDVIIRSFSKCRSRKVFQYMIKRLESEPDSVSYLALIETLKNATGQDFEDVAQWKDWLEKN